MLDIRLLKKGLSKTDTNQWRNSAQQITQSGLSVDEVLSQDERLVVLTKYSSSAYKIFQGHRKVAIIQYGGVRVRHP